MKNTGSANELVSGWYQNGTKMVPPNADPILDGSTVLAWSVKSVRSTILHVQIRRTLVRYAVSLCSCLRNILCTFYAITAMDLSNTPVGIYRMSQGPFNVSVLISEC